ncbi:MAG: DUF3141 domain-containing protein, partial [Pseudomonadota bacterium]
LAAHARAARKPIAEDNPFLLAERLTADMIEASFNVMRDMREALTEIMFFSLWASPMALAYGRTRAHGRTHKRAEDLISLPVVQDALSRIQDGGFAEGLLRALILLAKTRTDVRADRLERSSAILRDTAPFDAMPSADLAAMIARQTLIVDYAPDAALLALPKLLSTPADAARAVKTARFIVGDEAEMTAETRAMMAHIEGLLGQDASVDAAE